MIKTPKILAIDTSTDACSAALSLDNNCTLQRFVVSPREHTKLILNMVNELLLEAQIELKQLDAIAFGYGPGSFTGIRLAASVVQGLAFAANIPVIKISSLRTLAQEAFIELNKINILVAQDARMHEIYFGEYTIDSAGIMQAITPDKLIAPKQMQKTYDMSYVGIGNAWEIYNDILLNTCNISYIKVKIYPQASYMIQLAISDFAKGLAVSVKEALPIYLREEVAWT
jgi:tRNA threonylcarbamoyladenosine biosynthesis protein TsaB